MYNIIYLCPTASNHGCQWEGDATEIVHHFAEVHNDLLMDSNKITIDVTHDSQENRLMESKTGLFLVQTKVCVETFKLLIRLRFLQLSAKATSRVTYSIDVSSGLHGFTNETGSSDGYNPVCNSGGGVEIDFQTIGIIIGKKCVSNLIVTINIKGVDIVQNCNTNDELEQPSLLFATGASTDSDVAQAFNFFDKLNDIKSSLEELACSELNIKCFNCQQFMFPPIFLCPCGHSVCHLCKNGFCNECCLPITELRNTDLEEYSKTVEYPCKYEQQGCPEKYGYGQIRKHEVQCRYCIYTCAMCTYVGRFWDIGSHLRIAHPSTKIYEVMSDISFPKGSNFAIINREGVFYCTSYATDAFVEWKVVYCGPRERCFSCEVRLTGKKQYQQVKGYFLARTDNVFRWTVPYNELKNMGVKEKYAKLYISSY